MKVLYLPLLIFACSTVEEKPVEQTDQSELVNQKLSELKLEVSVDSADTIVVNAVDNDGSASPWIIFTASYITD